MKAFLALLAALVLRAADAVQQYQVTIGACRGGDSPGNYAGRAFFRDRNCMSRCNSQATCAGFVMGPSANNWCETYTSKNAKGDNRTQYRCYMKQGDSSPKLRNYVKSAGACRGGNSPQGYAGHWYHRNRNCKALCDQSAWCTGYVMPQSANSNWCETYVSAGARGDGRATFDCYMKSDVIVNTCCKEWTAACYTNGGEASCASKGQCKEACETPNSLNCMSCCSLQMSAWQCPEGGPQAVCRSYDKKHCAPRREVRQRKTLPECFWNLSEEQCDVKLNACTPLRNKECKQKDGCRVQRSEGKSTCVVAPADKGKECSELKKNRACKAREGECAWVASKSKCVKSQHGCPGLRKRVCTKNAKCIFTNRECKDKPEM